jgi:hypothetical protein
MEQMDSTIKAPGSTPAKHQVLPPTIRFVAVFGAEKPRCAHLSTTPSWNLACLISFPRIHPTSAGSQLFANDIRDVRGGQAALARYQAAAQYMSLHLDAQKSQNFAL